MLYYMFTYYGSECISNNKSHSSKQEFLHLKKNNTKNYSGFK